MTELRAVLVAGQDAQALREIRALFLQAGMVVIIEQVSGQAQLAEPLASRSWDVLLTDDRPELDAGQVLALAATHAPETPLIVLRHAPCDVARAAHLIDHGAQAVLHEIDALLLATMCRCLRQSAHWRDFQQTRLALEKNETRFRALAANLPGLVFQFVLEQDERVFFPYVSEGAKALLGLSAGELQASPQAFGALIVAEDLASYDASMRHSRARLAAWNWEGRVRIRDEQDIKWISLRATPRRTQQGAVLWDGIMLNITRNQQIGIELAQSRAQLAELAAYSQKAKEQERARIAREIHDDIGGTLTAIKCELLPCLDHQPRAPAFYRNKAAAIEILTDTLIDSTRRIALDLRPGILDCGIVAAVHWQAREFSRRTGIVCEVDCSEEDIALSSDLAVAVFRMLQESLTNITRHAQAAMVRVGLSEEHGWFYMQVDDDGRGLTDGDVDRLHSFGIRGMRERCQQLGGHFRIEGGAAAGTCVRIRIPLEGGWVGE
ncbi:MAG: histidine kinase [Nitrosomonas sp.]|nr:histidine kinase [Nitrosomonas sp.]